MNFDPGHFYRLSSWVPGAAVEAVNVQEGRPLFVNVSTGKCWTYRYKELPLDADWLECRRNGSSLRKDHWKGTHPVEKIEHSQLVGILKFKSSGTNSAGNSWNPLDDETLPALNKELRLRENHKMNFGDIDEKFPNFDVPLSDSRDELDELETTQSALVAKTAECVGLCKELEKAQATCLAQERNASKQRKTIKSQATPQPGDVVYDKMTGERGVLIDHRAGYWDSGGKVPIYRGRSHRRSRSAKGTSHDTAFPEALTLTRPPRKHTRPIFTHALLCAVGFLVGIICGGLV